MARMAAWTRPTSACNLRLRPRPTRSDSRTRWPPASVAGLGNNPLGVDSVHQTGPAYRSNNAGDGPEKTRDRKSWFPRFKSNWLGTFRSKQMFLCCECAVSSSSSSSSPPGMPTHDHQQSAAARYKGAEGKHCLCGRDQWHLAKAIEEAEYNRRMEISKALGGMRYDEAAVRLRSLGIPETDVDRIRDTFAANSAVLLSHVDGPQPRQARGGSAKRSRTSSAPAGANASRQTEAYSSPLSSTSTLSSSASPTSMGMPMAVSYSSAAHQQHYQQAGYTTHQAVKDYPTPYASGGYSPLNVDYSSGHGAGHGTTAASYDHYVAAAFTDEDGFGELLQGILEDDPRPASHRQLLPPRSGAFSALARPSHAFPGAPLGSEHDHGAAYYSHGLGRSHGAAYIEAAAPIMPIASRFLEVPPYSAGRHTPPFVPVGPAVGSTTSSFTTIV